MEPLQGQYLLFTEGPPNNSVLSPPLVVPRGRSPSARVESDVPVLQRAQAAADLVLELVSDARDGLTMVGNTAVRRDQLANQVAHITRELKSAERRGDAGAVADLVRALETPVYEMARLHGQETSSRGEALRVLDQAHVTTQRLVRVCNGWRR